MDEARIPPQFIKARRVATIPDVARGHKRVQHENRRRSPTLRARKKIGTRDVVRWKLCIDRTLPCNGSARPIGDYGRNFCAVRRGVIVLGGELLARRHIVIHFLTTARVQMMTRLKQIDRRAHEQIDTARRKAEELVVSTALCRRVLTSKSRTPRQSGVATFHTLSGRMRQIVFGQRKFFTQFGIKTSECGGEFAFNAFACREFLQSWERGNGIAKSDPNGRAPQWQPSLL